MACCVAANGTVHTCCTERNSFASCSDYFFFVHFAWWRGGWRGMLWEDSEKCLSELTIQCRGWVLQSAVRDTLGLHVGRELSVLIDSWNRRRAENGKETSESMTAVFYSGHPLWRGKHPHVLLLVYKCILIVCCRILLCFSPVFILQFCHHSCRLLPCSSSPGHPTPSLMVHYNQFILSHFVQSIVSF